ncbi:hypothetical protein ACPFL9_03410 [Paenarthrobacter sp. NyZ202]|uniref:hypothetical protein n=1 Tax=Paenarthrobacter sp. NyZ202 TaxID=3402689 RepID=UPI003CF7708A
MAKVPDQPPGALPGPDPGLPRDAPDSNQGYEVIGGGEIDDRFPVRRATPEHAVHPQEDARRALVNAVRNGGSQAWSSWTSWSYWLACSAALGLSWALAAATVSFGQANGWFESSVPSASNLLAAAWLAVLSAVLGTVWGFASSGNVLAVLTAGALRSAGLALPAGVLLAAVGAGSGVPIGVAGAAVVVTVVEGALFGLIGHGARQCFRSRAAGSALATVVLVVLCLANVVATVALLPSTQGTAQASVPVNVERDDAGRITSYECVGRPRPVDVAYTERVAWMAASHPALLLGGLAGGMVPRDHDLAWVLAGLQWAADGPARDVPCLDGQSSEGLPPSVPVAVTGLAVQVVVAAMVVVPGRRLGARRRRT